MTSRLRRPRPRPTWVESIPPNLLPASCALCGHDGAWDPARGLVLHPWLPACSVRVPQDEREEKAA